MIVGPVVAVIVSTALLYVHLRWALIDPQNPASQPSRLLSLTRAFALTLAIIIARGLSDSVPGFSTSAFFAFVLGFVLGPAIDPPETLTNEEEPRAIARWMHTIKIGKSGQLLKKIFITIPLTWALHYFGVPTPWYFAAGFVALLFSVIKTPTIILTMDNEKAGMHLLVADRKESNQARVRAANPLSRQSIIFLSLRGTLALAIWLALALPLVSSVPHLGFHDWKVIIAVAIGAVLSSIL